MNHKKAMPANGTSWTLNLMRIRRCGSVRSDCKLSAERAIRSIVSATSNSTPKTIPAIAADRRLRQKAAVRRGARTLTSINLLTLPLHVGEESRCSSGHLIPPAGVSLRYA
jgi:hypothetical protein